MAVSMVWASGYRSLLDVRLTLDRVIVEAGRSTQILLTTHAIELADLLAGLTDTSPVRFHRDVGGATRLTHGERGNPGDRVRWRA